MVLHRTLNKLDRIKAVFVVIQWDDETYDVDWSQMKVSELAMVSVLVSNEITKIVSGENRENAFRPSGAA